MRFDSVDNQEVANILFEAVENWFKAKGMDEVVGPLGISSAFIGMIMELLSSGKYTHAETNLNLEDNIHIQNQSKPFDAKLHKKRRSYIKKTK